VLPWSTWPIVPTFTCGFVRSNFSLDTIVFLPSYDSPQVTYTQGAPEIAILCANVRQRNRFVINPITVNRALQ
ncbi:hypothetical protein, partial [Vibrio diazotrophicus]|uniref:hypothetical protein n=1 Tax=Vibrio diazotrophicus TaxID=685 RepID=UPI001C3756DA